MTIGIFVVLVLVACAAAWLVLLPRARDDVADSISQQFSTVVADQIGVATIEPGQQKISLEALNAELEQNLDAVGVESVSISGAGQDIDVVADVGGDTVRYHGTLAVKNGKLVIEDIEGGNSISNFIVPADKLADAIESGVNEYFAQQGRSLESVSISGSEIILEVS